MACGRARVKYGFRDEGDWQEDRASHLSSPSLQGISLLFPSTSQTGQTPLQVKSFTLNSVRIFIPGSATRPGQAAARALLKQLHKVVLHAHNAQRSELAVAAVRGAEAC
jgi:hypothetical protein